MFTTDIDLFIRYWTVVGIIEVVDVDMLQLLPVVIKKPTLGLYEAKQQKIIIMKIVLSIIFTKLEVCNFTLTHSVHLVWIHSTIHSLIRSIITIIHSFIHLYAHTYIFLNIRLLNYSFTHLFSYSYLICIIKW